MNNKFIKIFFMGLLISLYGYSQSHINPIQTDKNSTWQPVIVDIYKNEKSQNKSNQKNNTSSTKTTVHYTQRINNYDTKVYGNDDITIRRTSVTYDPQYNMCVTLHITNNTIKKIVAIKVRMHYSSKELQSVDMEEVTKDITIDQEETEMIFLFGNPNPTYAFMMLGKIIVYFSDGTMQEMY